MHTPKLLIPALLAALALAGCATDDEAVEPVDGETVLPADDETVEDGLTGTPTDDESPLEDESPEATASPTPDGEFVTAEQGLILAPQEPIDAALDQRQEFGVLGDDVPPQLDIALLPCENVRFESGGVSFATQDGEAVGVGDTDTGVARIVSVNGEEIEPTTLLNDVDATDEPGSQDPAVAFEVTAEGADCAVPIAFEDADDDEKFDVTDERFTAGRITFGGS